MERPPVTATRRRAMVALLAVLLTIGVTSCVKADTLSSSAAPDHDESNRLQTIVNDRPHLETARRQLTDLDAQIRYTVTRFAPQTVIGPSTPKLDRGCVDPYVHTNGGTYAIEQIYARPAATAEQFQQITGHVAADPGRRRVPAELTGPDDPDVHVPYLYGPEGGTRSEATGSRPESRRRAPVVSPTPLRHGETVAGGVSRYAMLRCVQWSTDRYERALRAVAAIDPTGLVAMGCSYDEYRPEIDRLIPLAPVTVEQVRSVWLDMFDDTLGTLTDAQADQIAEAVNRE